MNIQNAPIAVAGVGKYSYNRSQMAPASTKWAAGSMTSPEYRHRGRIKQIMKEVDADFADKDGVFLFANDSVLDFYPKFGFKKADEYRYAKAVKGAGECSLSKVPMNSKDDWNKIYKIIENSAANGRFFMCEILNQLTAPYYLERTSCNNPANTRKTKAAIKKAFQNQIDGKGFSMVEIVTSCPTNWGLDPIKSLDFLEEKMLKEYPLGVVRDRSKEE